MTAPKPRICVPERCGAGSPHQRMKADLQCEGWDVKTCLYPDPVVPASKDTSGSDSNEQEGEEGRGTPGQRKAAEGARAPQTPRAGRNGLATRCAAPHADEWETREATPTARRGGRPRSLSPETPAFLSLLTIVTTDKCHRILAADPAVVRPSRLKKL